MSEETADAPQAQEPEVVTVAGIGDVTVRPLRLSERLRIKRRLYKAADEEEALAAVTAPLLSMSVVDKHGAPVKTADQWEDFGANRSGEAICNHLFNIAWRISELGPTDEEKAAAEKNSEASRS
jgi:hypothetical protein